jgi:hypothetical protein
MDILLLPRRYGGKAFSPPLTKLKMGSIEHVYIIKACVRTQESWMLPSKPRVHAS